MAKKKTKRPIHAATTPAINAPYSALDDDNNHSDDYPSLNHHPGHPQPHRQPRPQPSLQPPAYPAGHRRLLGATHPPGALSSFTVLFFINLFNFIDRYIPSATKGEISAEFGLSDLESSLPLTIFIVVYMCCCPVFGYLSDKGYNRKWLIAIGVMSWSVLTAATALAPNYAVYTAIRASVGIGEASYATIAPAILSDWYLPEDRSVMLGYFYVGVPVGAALGYGIGGVLGEAFGWRYAFVALGLPGVLMALLFLRTVDPPRGATDSKAALRASAYHVHETQWRAYSILLRNPIFMVSAVGLVLSTFGVGGLADWFPTYMRLKYPQLTEGEAGLLVGGVTVVGGIGGSVLGSWLGERTKGRLKNRYLAVSGWGSLVAAAGSLLIIVATPPVWVTTTVLVLAQITLWLYLGPITALVANVVATRHRTRAFAFQTFAQHAFGDAASPSIIGAVSDVAGLQLAVLLIPAVWLLAALVWVGGAWGLREAQVVSGEGPAGELAGADGLQAQDGDGDGDGEGEEGHAAEEGEGGGEGDVGYGVEGRSAVREGEPDTVSYMGYEGPRTPEQYYDVEGAKGWRHELTAGRAARYSGPEPPPPYEPPAYD